MAELGNLPVVTDPTGLKIFVEDAGAGKLLSVENLPKEIDLTNWALTENEATGDLMFSHLGVNKMRIDQNGNLTVVGDVVGFGAL